jgi:hypothetical protein
MLSYHFLTGKEIFLAETLRIIILFTQKSSYQIYGFGIRVRDPRSGVPEKIYSGSRIPQHWFKFIKKTSLEINQSNNQSIDSLASYVRLRMISGAM